MEGSAIGKAQRLVDRIAAVSRAGEWWEYKLVPILAIFYGTALMLRVPIWTLWPAALTLLAALVPGAAYVSIINDIADRRDDEAAGKRNRMAGRSRAQAAALVTIPILAGLAFAYAWRGNAPLCAAYLGAWAAFTLYSLPPFRLKARGVLGVFADASGAHLFPSLVAALLVFAAADAGADPLWLAAVGLWAGAYGLRGILLHQLADLDNDRAAAVSTFAHRRGRKAVADLARYVVFPVEAAAIAALLWQMQHPLAPLLLLLYALLARRRVVWWRMEAVLVQPRGRYLLILQDYYDVFLPLALLTASALRHPADAAVIAIHLLLFPNRLRLVLKEAWRLRTHASAHVPVAH
jgi:1,4-dihydroxy-2-naphthoate octaprenyltransferase